MSVTSESESSDRRIHRSWRSRQKQPAQTRETWRSTLRSSEMSTPSKRTWLLATAVQIQLCIGVNAGRAFIHWQKIFCSTFRRGWTRSPPPPLKYGPVCTTRSFPGNAKEMRKYFHGSHDDQIDAINRGTRYWPNSRVNTSLRHYSPSRHVTISCQCARCNSARMQLRQNVRPQGHLSPP